MSKSQAQIVNDIYTALFVAYLDDGVCDVRDLLGRFDSTDQGITVTILNECVELGTVSRASRRHYELVELDQKEFSKAHWNLRNNAWKGAAKKRASAAANFPMPTRASRDEDKYAYLASLPAAKRPMQVIRLFDGIPSVGGEPVIQRHLQIAARWNGGPNSKALPPEAADDDTTDPGPLIDDVLAEAKAGASK